MAGVDLVDPLTECVQALFAGVGTHALQGLDFVQHQQQTAIAGIAQHGQQAGQEVGGTEVVDVTLHASSSLDRSRHVGLAAQPGHQAVGGRVVAGL
jgi:hypothetical protein